jgi:glycosyltransferase involved in cell wall biosynthesis
MVVERLHALGGAQEQAVRLCRALRAHGISTRIVTGRWRRSEPRRTEMGGVPVTAVFTAFKMFDLKGLRKFGVYLYLANLFLHLLLHRRSYDIIHVHSATVSAFVVTLAGRWLGKPAVMKVMASGRWGDFKRMREGGILLGSRLMLPRLRQVDRVICLNREVEEECRAEGFLPEQCFSVPNGIPAGEVKPRADYRGRGDAFRAVFAGRLDRQKNPVLILEAMARSARLPGGDRLEADFLGDGPERAALEERARALGVSGRVRFAGRVNDVPRRLEEADAFVLPSLSEGVSNALLEAMAHGLPCIATDIPGNADLIRDRETGLLVRTGDADALARAMLELAADPALRERLGRAARTLVEERFDMGVIAARYAALYRELAAGARPARPSPRVTVL